MIGSPGLATATEADFVSAMSANGRTSTEAVSVGALAVTSESAVAELVTVVPAIESWARARIVIPASSLTASVPRAQLTVVVPLTPAAELQLPAVEVAETKSSPAGSVSTTVVAVPADGPLFRTSRLKVTREPALTSLSSTDLLSTSVASGANGTPAVEASLRSAGLFESVG